MIDYKTLPSSLPTWVYQNIFPDNQVTIKHVFTDAKAYSMGFEWEN